MGNGDVLKGGRGIRQSGTFRQDIKAFPVIFTDPELCDRFPVDCRAISLIVVPAIMRKFQVKSLHILVPPGFGQDAGCCNGGVEGVALYDAVVGDFPVAGEPVAVYEQESRCHSQSVGASQSIESEVHGFERGVEDIDPVDFFLIYEGDAPGKRFGLNNDP